MKIQILVHLECYRPDEFRTVNENQITPTMLVLDEDELRSVVGGLRVVEDGIALGSKILLRIPGVYPAIYGLRVVQILPVPW